MNDNRQAIICLMGPTAAGKTDLSLKLVERFPCEIISVDSALIYRDMNIGTGKPEKNILEKFPHHLIDILEPTESYSAAKFREDTLQKVNEIFSKGKTPLLVGGTMLYFKALRDGLAELPQANMVIRAQLESQMVVEGSQEMHAKLAIIDPVTAAKIHQNDPQRILRALEVFAVTGKTLSEHLVAQSSTPLPFNIISWVIAPLDRKQLHMQIANRFERMLKAGFVEEVEQLTKKYSITPDLPAMRSVGYRQILQYLQGEFSFEEMQNRCVFATRQLAKRQLTWLRAWPHAQWCEHGDPRIFESIASMF